MLARDRVRLTLDGRAYTLTPSLRAAMRLERGFGMAAVLKGIGEGSASMMAAVVRECADLDRHLTTILDSLCRPTLAVNLTCLREPLAGLVIAMHGVDPEAEQRPIERKPGDKVMTFAEHLAQLYRFGTGWLGWTPEVTLSATPFEIVEAFNGHVDKLKAIHCVAETKAEAQPELSLEEKFKGFSMSLRARPKKAV